MPCPVDHDERVPFIGGERFLPFHHLRMRPFDLKAAGVARILKHEGTHEVCERIQRGQINPPFCQGLENPGLRIRPQLGSAAPALPPCTRSS